MSIDGDSLRLEDGGAVALDSLGSDDQLLSIDGDSLRIEDGGAVALDSLGTDDQLLSIDGDSLRLEDGGAVALDSLGTDDQLLSIDGDSLRLEDGGAVALDSLGSDDQLLSIDGDSLRLEDGGAVALDSLGSDDQLLTIDGDSLRLEDGGAVALNSFALIDDDGDTQVQVEESTDDDVIRFDAKGIEVARFDSSEALIVTDFNVTGPSETIGVSSSSSSGSVGSTFSTVVDVSTLVNSTLSLASMTISPSDINGGLHNFGDPNTTTIGIVVSDPTILLGNLATSYWIFARENASRCRWICAEFQLSGNDLQVRYTTRRFLDVGSIALANQTDAYFSTAGSASIGTALPNISVNYNFPGDPVLETLLFADNSSANVGVGTDSPSSKLHVVGNARITNIPTGSSSSDGIVSVDGSGNLRQLTLASLTNGDAWGVDDDDDVSSSISRSGNVGIGLGSPFTPSQSLDVRGGVFLGIMPAFQQAGTLILGRADNPTVRFHSIETFNSETTADNYVSFNLHDGVGTSTVTNVLTLRGNNRVGIGTNSPAYELDVVGDINASNNVRAAGTILTSDQRLKTDVKEVENALAIVEKLQAVQYRKKQSITSEDYSKHEFGFIAQEVRKLLPTLVTEGNDKDKLLALDYNSLISILTKAIQEQQMQIESLKDENETLQSYLLSLKTQISLIQEALEQENILEVDKNTLKD